MSPSLACSPSLIISGLAPMKSSWISWKWVAGEEGAWKAFHQAGKLKKHFGYQALADLACACLIFRFFHSFSSTIIFSFTTFLIEQSEAWPEVTPQNIRSFEHFCVFVLFLYTWKWITTSTFPRLRKEVCPRIPCEAKFELHHQLTGFGFFHSTRCDCSKDNLSEISAHYKQH